MEIAESSNPRGEYYYAPQPSDLQSIYDSIALRIMNVSGEDPDPYDTTPMITYILPHYINFVPDTFQVEPNSIETDPAPDKITYNSMNTVLEWDVDTIYINESWIISFEITSTKPGWVPVNSYPDSFVYYTNPIFKNLTIPFPEIWIEVLPLPDLVPIDITIDDTPYLSESEIVDISPKQKVKISAKVNNIGDVNTDLFANDFHMNYHNMSQPLEPFFETSVDPLEALRISERYHSFWESPGIEGLYRIVVFVDSTDMIPESIAGEMNNRFNITLRVQKPRSIDLILTNVIIDQISYDYMPIELILEVEQTTRIQARAMNLGNRNTDFYAPHFHVAYYETFSPLYPFLNVMIDSLEPSERTNAYTYNWTAPSIPGIYKVILFVDSMDEIPEDGPGAEANNKVHIKFNVTKEPLVDLVITNVNINNISYTTSLPGLIDVTIDKPLAVDLVTGQTVNISSRAMNLGDANTDVFSSEFYISYYNTSALTSSYFEQFLYEPIRSLSPLNVSARYLSNWTAPLVPGVHNVILSIDSTDVIPEGLNLESENNNRVGIEFTVYELLPPPAPELDDDGEDVVITWKEVQDAEYYYIYGGPTPQTIDFTDPLDKCYSNNWTHDLCLAEFTEYYYIIRSIDVRDWAGYSSNIIGFNTFEFQKGYNSFSLPLEPFNTRSAHWYADDMFPSQMYAGNIYKYDTSQQKWIGHPRELPEGLNDFSLIVGETYMLYTDKDMRYTFTGRPGTNICYVDGIKDDVRIGTGAEFRTSLKLTAGANGVILDWKPANDVSRFEKVDHYNIYRSTARYSHDSGNPIKNTSFGTPQKTSYTDLSINYEEGEYYYTVVPVNQFGREGSSTYSVGIIIKSCARGYNGFALPLRLTTNINYYPEDGNIYGSKEEYPNEIETIYYYNCSKQRWIGEPRLLPEVIKNIQAIDHRGYLIYVSADNFKFIFIGQ